MGIGDRAVFNMSDEKYDSIGGWLFSLLVFLSPVLVVLLVYWLILVIADIA